MSQACKVLLNSDDPEVTKEIMCSTVRHKDWTFVEGHKENFLTEFNLYCDRKWLISMGGTLYFVGFFFAVAPLSSITDKIGRKRSTELFVFSHILLILLLAISTSLYQVIICRILLGAAHGGMSVAMSVAFYEFTTAKPAMLNMMISSAGFSLGGGLSGLVAMWSAHWMQTLLPPLVGFAVLLTLFHFIVPETPHWLFAKGNESAAICSLNKVAQFNGYPALQNVGLVSVSGEATSSKKYQKSNILWNIPFLRNSIARLSFAWFTVAICYYGLEFNAGSLGNEYVIMMLMGCFDTPFKLAMYVYAGKVGRQWACQTYLGLAMFCLILSGVPALNLISIYGSITLKIILVACGRALGAAVFALLYIYTTEILPTLVRSLGLSCCSTAARVGSLLSPCVILVDEISPYIIYVFTVVCLMIAMKLLRGIPETLGKPLPNNLEDCEKLFCGGEIKRKKVEDPFKLDSLKM